MIKHLQQMQRNPEREINSVNQKARFYDEKNLLFESTLDYENSKVRFQGNAGWCPCLLISAYTR